MCFFVASSVKFPCASKRSAALPIITSGWLIGNIFRKTKTWRRWYCARAVPMVPIEAPMIATGFPFHALSPYGSGAPIDRVLQNPRDRVVIFRRHEENGICIPDAPLQLGDLRRWILFLVLIEAGNPIKLKYVEGRAFGHEFSSGAQGGAIV